MHLHAWSSIRYNSCLEMTISKRYEPVLRAGWCTDTDNKDIPEEVLKRLTFFTPVVLKSPFYSHPFSTLTPLYTRREVLWCVSEWWMFRMRRPKEVCALYQYRNETSKFRRYSQKACVCWQTVTLTKSSVWSVCRCIWTFPEVILKNY